jgi:hypothetical protein
VLILQASVIDCYQKLTVMYVNRLHFLCPPLVCSANYVDQGFPVDVIYLDFKEAFDKLPRRRLLLKINSLGINGSIFKWIENWLQNREQRMIMLGSIARGG